MAKYRKQEDMQQGPNMYWQTVVTDCPATISFGYYPEHCTDLEVQGLPFLSAHERK